MIELVFVVFDDEGGGFNAVEGKYSLIVIGEDKMALMKEIRNAVLDYFGPDFNGKIIIREIQDEVLCL